MKKVISAILTLVLVFSLTCLPAYAADKISAPTKLTDPVYGNNFTYSYQGNTLTIKDTNNSSDQNDRITALLPFMTVENKADQNVILASIYDSFGTFTEEIPFLFHPLIRSGKINTVTYITSYGTTTMKFHLNSHGRVTQVTYPNNKNEMKTATFQYDSKNRLISGNRKYYSEMVEDWVDNSLKVTYGKNDSVTSIYLYWLDDDYQAKCTSDSNGRILTAKGNSQDWSANKFTYKDGKLNSITLWYTEPTVSPTVSISNNNFYLNHQLLPISYTTL